MASNQTFLIGAHLSIAKGFAHIARQAASIGANTFQFFTRNPRGGAAKAANEADIEAYIAFAGEAGIGPVLAHAPYTLNMAASKPELRRFAVDTITADLAALSAIPQASYNIHPGAHVGQGVQEGIRLIAECLSEAAGEGDSQILLECMAGAGSQIGAAFEELAEILSRAARADRLGVCLDTCHVYAGGYDVAGDLDGVLRTFDDVILSRLKAVHLNDSMAPLGSHKDRHQKIGEGEMGLSCFGAIVNHPALRGLPFYLETPNEIDGYAREIAMLKGMRQ